MGSHLSKYVKDERVLDAFIEIELLVGLIGGVSAAVLFLVFAWAGEPFRLVLYGLVFVIGVLVGMEIPLVMRAMNQRQASFSELVSQVLTFDYLGALAVSLLFPLVLAPRLGLSRSCCCSACSTPAWRYGPAAPSAMNCAGPACNWRAAAWSCCC